MSATEGGGNDAMHQVADEELKKKIALYYHTLVRIMISQLFNLCSFVYSSKAV